MEDEPDIRELIAICIELAGWQAIAAPDAAQGLDLARRELPDAIVLDVMMPGTDGPTTLAKLRAGADTRAIPVVFITAKTDPTTRTTLEGLGAAGVIVKPFDTGALTRQIADLVGWPSADG